MQPYGHSGRILPAQYVETYRASLDNSKKAEKIAAIMDLGYDRKMATALYKLYQRQTDVVAWYEGK